ncbi:heparinase II/III family protein [Yoonia sediminilitoris]|uniref:Putative heparinase superfamily protein n=1 Tax=Yoonia sediminilitoris TaxID=1286148 RepID=A0A2T6KMZ7_9RHOB|nr:heparinase II/III family protein [Yoonia sediminilitoris]PUB17592.1 putative heparinase superfamily protein [Yoonia sediminilitoris]RCW97887.1 putative heparinase superfamily protein [Yoonia sediminilitoris]
MADTKTIPDHRIGLIDRFHARRAGMSGIATAFASAPEPRTIGDIARGRQLMAGNFLFSGQLTASKELSIWDIAEQKPDIAAEIHGCLWLDDLAAVSTQKARQKAQDWVFDWIARYGKGGGPGWTPDLTGRRLIRWINHGFFLLRGRGKPESDAFFRSLAGQATFLSRRWRIAPAGLPRFEALAGTIYAGLALEGMEGHVHKAVTALAADCDKAVDVTGSIASRNPEELLAVLNLIIWAVQALTETNRTVPSAMTAAITRIAPTLRALRHADGALARFHGGGPGIEGQLDAALAAADTKALSPGPLHMGYLRLKGARTTVIVDASSPPAGAASVQAHASTLAFELTSGRRPLIVNCGSGAMFGPEWRRACRATPSHSTLGIEGVSSSQLGENIAGRELLSKTPTDVRCYVPKGHFDRRFEMSHDGYCSRVGLTHGRMLDLSIDGRTLEGEDVLAALDPKSQALFDATMARCGGQGIPYHVRFHLHPDVHATLDMNNSAVSMTLKSGEVWVFQHEGNAQLGIAPSVYLENGRLKPRETTQVVLTGRAMSYAERVRWTLAKAQSTPDVLRDLVQTEPMDAID